MCDVSVRKAPGANLFVLVFEMHKSLHTLMHHNLNVCS